MKCPFCGRQSDYEICPFCGMDPKLADKIRHTADRLYREAYSAAVSGDIYRAKTLMKDSLFYNAQDIRALNFAGLLHYRTGEIYEALGLWQKSLSIDGRSENRAKRYLTDLNKRETKLRAKKEAVRLYNEALEQAKNGSLDFAIARLKKAGSLSKHHVNVQLLLALCYMEQGRYRMAASCLDKAAHVDPLHPLIARYRKYMTNIAEQGAVDADDEDIQDVSETHSIRSTLSEPDIGEIFGNGRGRRVRLRNWHQTLSQILMFAVGAACMYGFIYTLKIPDELTNLRKETAAMREEVTGREAAAEQMQQDMLKAQQYEYEAEQKNADLEKQIESLIRELTEAGKTDLDDALARAAVTYMSGSYTELASALRLIDADKLSDDSRALYDLLERSLAGGANQLYESGLAAFNASKEEEEGSDAEKEQLEIAYANLRIAAENLEEKSYDWYMANYYFACTCYRMGDYQAALDIANSLLSDYYSDDDFYYWLIELSDDCRAAMS